LKKIDNGLILCERRRKMKIEFSAIFQKVAEGYIGFVEELPGANSQGNTLDEARTNLKEAIQLVIDSNREITEEEIRGKEVIRESLLIGAS
jgi:predicted RNase H-like HicB family nuclease